MTTFQIVYVVVMVLLVYPAWGQQRYALAWLWANLAATLAACLAMDVGYLDRDGATASMMVIDICAGVALCQRPGLPRLISWGYVVTVPIYAANIAFDVQTLATYAILNAVAALQVGVLVVGMGSGGGGIRGRFGRSFPLAIPPGQPAVSHAAFRSNGERR